MVECSECKKFYDCLYGGELVGRLTSCPDFQQKPKTNAEHIRAMSDEELAETLVRYDGVYDVYRTDGEGVHYDWDAAVNEELEWLKQPAE